MTSFRSPIIAAFLSIMALSRISPAAADVVSPSFDCSSATRATEIAICRSEYLAGLDRQMVDLYIAARASTGAGGKKLLRQEQRRFLVERNACGAWPACIHHAYQDRISDLQAWVF